MMKALKNKLSLLRQEHRLLDENILQIMGQNLYDQLEVQRLKRKKLKLKDEILRLQRRLVPDIIA